MTLSMLYSTLSKLIGGSMVYSDSTIPEDFDYGIKTNIKSNNNNSSSRRSSNKSNNNNNQDEEEEEKDSNKEGEGDIQENDMDDQQSLSSSLENREDCVDAHREYFGASLMVHPFTLKNMAKKYVNDLEWSLDFANIRWTLFLHVPFYQKDLNTVASIGLKIRSHEISILTEDMEDEMVSSSATTRSNTPETASCTSFSSIEELAIKQFAVSWQVMSKKKKAVFARNKPTLCSIETGEEYVVEFADDEFDFGEHLDDGLLISLQIKSIVPTS